MIGIWLAITVIIVISSHIVESTDLVIRAAQIYSILIGLMLYSYKTWELTAFIICSFFASLFSIKLIAYGEMYLTGFMPIGIVVLGLLYYRLFEQSPRVFITIWYTALFLSCLYIFASVEILGIETNDIVKGSRNHITTLLLPLFAVLFVSARYSVDYRDKMPRVLILGIAVALILVLYTGRTGVMSAFIITLITILVVVLQRYWGTLLLAAVSLVVVGLVLLSEISAIVETSRGIQRLSEEQVTENIRFLLWAEAAGYMMDSNYALGVPEGFWSANLPGGLTIHNSYLEIYGLYGWTGLTAAMAVIILMFYRVAKADLIVSILVFALLLRSVFDTTLLSLVLGPAYIFITIVAIRQRRAR